MGSDTGPVFGIIFAIAYLGFVVTWVTFATKRMRPWIRQRLGDYWGVTIVERYRFRNQSWEVSGPHTWRQGCMVSIAQFVVDFGCMVGPIFLALGIMGSVLIILSDQ